MSIKNNVTVASFKPEGLGFGEGAISVASQLSHPEKFNLTTEALEAGEAIITSGTPFVAVEADDDGCGDGRPTEVIYQYDHVDDHDDERHEFHRSLSRAKIFGGGLVAASSMLRSAAKGDVRPGETILGDRNETADLLEGALHYGGHTDTHALDEKCGCGAIDAYPSITKNALVFKNQIMDILREVYGEQFPDKKAAIDAVFSNYETQIASTAYFEDAAGSKTMELMERHGSVIKQLADEHMEDFAVINFVTGTTFDQRRFDAEMKSQGVNGTVQVFVIDVWRAMQYADIIADIAAEKYDRRRTVAYDKAMADFWIRTLAVTATLTAGDLPVFIRQ
jgi:hypothetical protein